VEPGDSKEEVIVHKDRFDGPLPFKFNGISTRSVVGRSWSHLD